MDYKTYKIYFKHIWAGLTNKEKDFLGRSGCGPDNCKILAAIIPEMVFKTACKKHDCAYHLGGTKEHKKWADKLFYDNMCLAVKKESKWLRWWYYGWAKIYVKAVSNFGGSSFKSRGLPLHLCELKDLIKKLKR